MKLSSLSGSSHQDYHRVDEFLEEHDPYICAQARRYGYDRRGAVHPDVLDLEIDDLIQQTRIKVWLAWRKQHTHIENPRAYIGRVAHNEFITMLRQSKQMASLLEEEEDELYQYKMVIGAKLPLDPLHEIEQKETIAHYIGETASAVSALPDGQRQAMLCSLKDRVDDLPTLIELFKAYSLDIEAAQWPTEHNKRQSMKSSLSVARKKIRAKIQGAIKLWLVE